jgi:hypothetical protein
VRRGVTCARSETGAGPETAAAAWLSVDAEPVNANAEAGMASVIVAIAT